MVSALFTKKKTCITCIAQSSDWEVFLATNVLSLFAVILTCIQISYLIFKMDIWTPQALIDFLNNSQSVECWPTLTGCDNCFTMIMTNVYKDHSKPKHANPNTNLIYFCLNYSKLADWICISRVVKSLN